MTNLYFRSPLFGCYKFLHTSSSRIYIFFIIRSFLRHRESPSYKIKCLWGIVNCSTSTFSTVKRVTSLPASDLRCKGHWRFQIRAQPSIWPEWNSSLSQRCCDISYPRYHLAVRWFCRCRGDDTSAGVSKRHERQPELGDHPLTDHKSLCTVSFGSKRE